MIDASTILAIALKTSLLMIVIGVLSVVLGKKSAAYRHFLWTSALALSLLMPFAIVCMPSFAVIPVPWHASERLPNVLAKAAEEGIRAGGLSAAIAPTIVLIWSIGAFGLLIREGLAVVGLIRWIRRARPLGSLRWVSTLAQVSNELGVNRSVRVLECPHVASPCTWGFVQPVLLLPFAGADWPESQRRHALLHELAHIRRFDYVSTLVSRLACAMHWYNPLVWFAAAQARILQEHACDDAVLRGGGRPSEYAQFLLNIADVSNSGPYPARVAMCMTRRSHLHGRVVAILDPHKTRLQVNSFAVLVAFVPLSCLMLLLATTATASDAPVEPVEAIPPVQPIAPIPPVQPIEAILAVPAVPAVPAEPPVPADPPSPPQSAK